MDPNATLSLVLESLHDNDTQEAIYLLMTLRDWIDSGGFSPVDRNEVAEMIEALNNGDADSVMDQIDEICDDENRCRSCGHAVCADWCEGG